MTTRHGGRARRIALACAAALTLVLGACGDSDDDGNGDASGDSSEQAAGGDVEAYCEAELEIETIGEPDIDFENASEEEQQAAAKEFATAELLPKAKAVQEEAPEEREGQQQWSPAHRASVTRRKPSAARYPVRSPSSSLRRRTQRAMSSKARNWLA